jgi:hypothetical protein
MEHTTIAVDLAKSVFQVAVSHHPGHVDEERRLSRDRFHEFFAQRSPATVLVEACGSAHYWRDSCNRSATRCGCSRRMMSGRTCGATKRTAPMRKGKLSACVPP